MISADTALVTNIVILDSVLNRVHMATHFSYKHRVSVTKSVPWIENTRCKQRVFVFVINVVYLSGFDLALIQCMEREIPKCTAAVAMQVNTTDQNKSIFVLLGVPTHLRDYV